MKIVKLSLLFTLLLFFVCGCEVVTLSYEDVTGKDADPQVEKLPYQLYVNSINSPQEDLDVKEMRARLSRAYPEVFTEKEYGAIPVQLNWSYGEYVGDDKKTSLYEIVSLLNLGIILPVQDVQNCDCMVELTFDGHVYRRSFKSIKHHLMGITPLTWCLYPFTGWFAEQKSLTKVEGCSLKHQKAMNFIACCVDDIDEIDIKIVGARAEKVVDQKRGINLQATGKSVETARLAEENRRIFERSHVSTWQLPNGVSLEMVGCPAGSFTMGCPSNSPEACFSVKQHTENISSPYLIGKYEVTQKQFVAVMGRNPSYFKGDDRPVEMVTSDDAKEFCRKLNRIFAFKLPQGYFFTLPTEAEWEWAAYGCDHRKPFDYSGSNDVAEVAWYGYNAEGKTHNCGEKRSNQIGLYDMSGNVFERCYSTKEERQKKSDANSCRGGAWGAHPVFCRPAANAGEGKAVAHVGFRIVLAPIK